jgi:hypothetical protein
MSAKDWIEAAQIVEYMTNAVVKVILENNGVHYLVYDGEKEGNPARDKRWGVPQTKGA